MRICGTKFSRGSQMIHNLNCHRGGHIWVLWIPQEYEVKMLAEHA